MQVLACASDDDAACDNPFPCTQESFVSTPALCVSNYRRGGVCYQANYDGHLDKIKSYAGTNQAMWCQRTGELLDTWYDDTGTLEPLALEALHLDLQELMKERKRCADSYDVMWGPDNNTMWTNKLSGIRTTYRPGDEELADVQQSMKNVLLIKAAIVSYKSLHGSSLKEIKTFVRQKQPSFSNKSLKKAIKDGVASNELVQTNGRFLLAPPQELEQCQFLRKPSSERGAGALPFVRGSKRKIAADVASKRPAPHHPPRRLGNGCVPYRTDAVEVNSVGDRECVLEMLRFACGTYKLTRKLLGLPLKGDVCLKQAIPALEKKTPFRVQRVKQNHTWESLLGLEPGIYVGRVVVKNTNDQHYICIDRWRNLLFVGGPPTIAAETDAVDACLLEDVPGNSVTAPNADRYFFIEPHELEQPHLFAKFMKRRYAVHGTIDMMYRMDVVAARAHETAYNTPALLRACA